MNDLKLNQTIFANSTCYFNGEVIQICKTTLADAITEGNRTVIKLGGGHNWGCIPTRERHLVIANKKDIRPFISERIERRNKLYLEQKSLGLTELLESGKILLCVENYRDRVQLTILSHSRTYNSLAEGKIMEFTQEYKTLKLRDLNKLPNNIFNNLEKAIQYLENMILSEL
jgi:hypothetical protein